MKRIYFDNCTIQRPFDDQQFARIRLETEAVSLLLALCQSSSVSQDAHQAMLLVSEISIVENNKNPNSIRKAFGAGIIRQASELIIVNDTLSERARQLIQQSITPFDALHLACAESAQADYFCTCDDKLLKKVRTLQSNGVIALSMTICTPITCVELLS
jgi:predicted nucleic acid-binding protein